MHAGSRFDKLLVVYSNEGMLLLPWCLPHKAERILVETRVLRVNNP